MVHKLLIAWQGFQAFFHLPALFLTLMLPLLGTAGLTTTLSGLQLLALLAIAINFHIFAYVLNDFIDLPIDRTKPTRSDDPLVRGIVKPWQALLIALVQFPIALTLTLLLGSHVLAFLILAISFAFMGIYDIWGKRCFFPPFTDLAQGLGWATLALFGASVLQSGPWSRITWVIFVFIAVFFVMSNGVHGSLKDLSNDLKHHRRTTALLFGARKDERGTVLPLPLKVYAFLLQLLLIATLLIPLIRNSVGYERSVWYPITFATIALVLLSFLWPLWAIRLKREKSQYVYAALLQLGLLLIALLVMCLPLLQPPVLVLLAAIYLMPLVILPQLRHRITVMVNKFTLRSLLIKR